MLDFKWYSGNLGWLRHSTIFLAKGGSHSYGTNIETSDEDYRGVAIPPKRYFHGFVDKFEQVVQSKPDVTIFDVRKFFKLAADCNPSIIEILFTDPADQVVCRKEWETIRDQRQRFLSQRAMHTFSGYAMSQLKRIKTHRRWLLEPPKKHPERADFGLPDAPTLEKEQFGVVEAKIRKLTDTIGGEGFTKDQVEEVDAGLVEKVVVTELQLSPNLVEIIVNERRYNAAMRNWAQYQKWKEERNPARAALEAAHGYDCYLDDTEFLTERGWLRYDEIGDTDRLATLNQETGYLEMQGFTERVSKPYNGPIHFIETRTTSCAVTPNHRMWLSPVRRSQRTAFSTRFSTNEATWKIIRASDTVNGHRSYFHARSATEGTSAGSGVTDDVLITVGAYVSEGCVGKRTKDGPSVLRFSQMDGGRLVKYMDMFNGATWGSSERTLFKKFVYPRKNRTRCEITWTLANRALARSIVDWCGEKSHQKHLPGWITMLNKRQARLLMNVLIAGDGTHKKFSDIYYTVSKRLADDIQTLAAMCGYGSQIWGPYPNKQNRAMYQVYITKNQYSVVTPSHQDIQTVFNKRIVCFTVPNEVLVTRRNNKVAIQGNTKHGMHLVRLMRMAIEIMRDGTVLVRRPDAEELLSIRRGAWTFDRLMEWAYATEAELAMEKGSSPLPHEPDRKRLDELLCSVVEGFLGYPYLGPRLV